MPRSIRQGGRAHKVLLYAYLNAANETGFVNPIDEAIRECHRSWCGGLARNSTRFLTISAKALEHPLSKRWRSHLLVTKGALRQMLAVCATRGVERRVAVAQDTSVRRKIERHWREFSDQGHRVLGVAYREFGAGPAHHA